MLTSVVRRRLSTATAGKFRVVEVGARDGLQNEKQFVPTAIKIELIERLGKCGLKTIEATSFVSPKWVPQMGDHQELMAQLKQQPGVAYPVLCPNMAGLKNILKQGSIHEIAAFSAASDSFSKKNTNADVATSLTILKEVVEVAKANNIRVRGYVSCVIGCPYEGPIDPNFVARVCEKLLDAGCYEVSLGDTIGVGNAGSVGRMLDTVLESIPADKLAVHFHDTYGQALANVLLSIQKGIRTADSSVAGLGGCPYAKGATGNLATEDLVYMLQGLGFETGISLNELVDTSQWICEHMKRDNASRVANAILAKRK